MSRMNVPTSDSNNHLLLSLVCGQIDFQSSTRFSRTKPLMQSCLLFHYSDFVNCLLLQLVKPNAIVV